MNNYQEFCEFLSTLLNETVTEGSPLINYKRWDSVNVLRIIKHFEEKYQKSFSIKDFLLAKNVDDLYQLTSKN